MCFSFLLFFFVFVLLFFGSRKVSRARPAAAAPRARSAPSKHWQAQNPRWWVTEEDTTLRAVCGGSGRRRAVSISLSHLAPLRSYRGRAARFGHVYPTEEMERRRGRVARAGERARTGGGGGGHCLCGCLCHSFASCGLLPSCVACCVPAPAAALICL